MMSKSLKVVELFAGVGGFRLGLEGWKGMSPLSGYTKPLSREGTVYATVWSNQWEPSTKRQHASEIYTQRWPDGSHSNDDIGEVPTHQIPDHDLLVGGFPCQDYSVATTLKNSGGLFGKKGVLWWQIERILREKGSNAPNYLLFENVDRLLKSPSTQRGRDFAVILASLDDLGYAVSWRVINAADYGMPQKRRRVFFLGYRKGTSEYEQIQRLKAKEDWIEDGVLARALPCSIRDGEQIESGRIDGDLKEVSERFNNHPKSKMSPFEGAGVMIERKYVTTKVFPDCDADPVWLRDILQPLNEVPEEFLISEKDIPRWEYLKGAKREPRVNKALGYSYIFSEGALAFPDVSEGPSRTIITGEGGSSPSRTKHVVRQQKALRRLTPVELERLNMFPDNHTLLPEVSNGKRAFLMGNALVVGVVEAIGRALADGVTIPSDSIPSQKEIVE